MTLTKAFKLNFLGEAPSWYKNTIILFLIINPILYFTAGHFIAGWVLIAEFIFTLAMALKCYPLPAGGLLAIEAVVIGMTDPHLVYKETLHNFPVILLLMFMVAGIYFMREGLLFLFSRLLTKIRSKIAISLVFSFLGAFLSAFLDALTVTAVIITVAYGFYNIYHKVASGKGFHDDHSVKTDEEIKAENRRDLDEFRGFLRNLMMHGAVGTALGGATTLVGEPQNLLIGHMVGWHFMDFFINCAPVSIPVLFVGIITCFLLEKFKLFGYGYKMPENVRKVLVDYVEDQNKSFDNRAKMRLIVQAIVGVLLIISLALHVAEVGLIGLMVIILLTAFNGIIDEHRIGHAFEEALPFTALLVVFFTIVAVIHSNHLFQPVIDYVLGLEGTKQLAAYFLANGALSAISDNVFVATVYMSETVNHFKDIVPLLGENLHKATAEQMEQIKHLWKLAVSINMGTNIPSVATPNGQAAFLFLLTSALAPVIRLSYMEMVKLAFPYTVTMTITGLLATIYFL
ncbi:Na+:H+ antiporter NhaB family [Deferribacter desulfuricans SSM1]|uniref:Na+:H+ antiporter NhaB family n=1 Tax=Deferribacter desulfuricans (strain DSM 14783 / JCM 11476 / NBRC 101012 / SSM1) TaxID=639282 RepID=D3PA67_DEFDS|nr:sodium/proton antiporter NhaB [Deferribacter desulfuricans]BAI81607.1 Na+:H+ antiporter NhaB family [Deferribacter desulfuricans SSM1]